MKVARPRTAILAKVFAAVFVAAVGTASAQTVSLRGQVTDQNGAIVVGARVTARGPTVKTTTTDSTGSYLFSNLAAGLQPQFARGRVKMPVALAFPNRQTIGDLNYR